MNNLSECNKFSLKKGGARVLWFFRALRKRPRRRGIVLWTTILLLCGHPELSSEALAAAVNLPRTGQVACFDSLGSIMACSGTGQDGDKKAGVDWPVPRFTVGTGSTAACVTDTLTGLMWVKSAYSQDMGWQAALDYVKNTINASPGICGYTDWRMPTVVELESLVNAGYANPNVWLNGAGFSDVGARDYWSSTSFGAGDPWCISMNVGSVQQYGTSNYLFKVWPVRSVNGGATAAPWKSGQKTSYDTTSPQNDDGALRPGMAWPSPRFTINYNGATPDGTVTDNLTGLVWLKNANCFGNATWSGALSLSKSLASGACGLADGSVAGDWRLPNRKELFSLVDFAYSSPALSNAAGTAKWAAGDPFDNIQSNYYYWSSSTLNFDTKSAWKLYIGTGSLTGSWNKTSGVGYYVWPVRSGPVTLTVNANGTGNGSVEAVVNTTKYVQYDYPDNMVGTTPKLVYGTQVNVNAMVDDGSSFKWTGICSGNANPCVVTLDADKSVAVTFTSKADLMGLPVSGPAPLMVSFIDKSTNAPASWLWEFGDNEISGLQNPTHVYRVPGIFDVKLTAANSIASAVITQTGYIQVTSCASSKARRLGISDDSIQVLYNSGSSGDIIEAQATEFAGGLLFGQNKVIALKGGYDCGFNKVFDYSVIQGAISIGGPESASGTIIIDGIGIE